jgi:GT2 family glycosyltransferase
LKLSIIIVSWNTWELLEGCLTSIYAHPPNGEFEVFVVDNASSDGSAQMVEERFPAVHLIENHENVGFARANNQAIIKTTSPSILLLNPDTEVKQGAFDKLINFMDDHPRAGAAGSRLLNPDGSLQTSCHPQPTLLRELWRLFHLDKIHPYGIYPMHAWDLEVPRSVEVLQGASLILRREALDQIGLLDEDYFVYSEEVDLCFRLQKAGWELYWVPDSQVIHHEGESTKLISDEMFLQLYKSKLLYFRKHHGFMAAAFYKGILFCAGLARLLVSPLAWLERPPRRQHHLSLAGNYFRMLMALPAM